MPPFVSTREQRLPIWGARMEGEPRTRHSAADRQGARVAFAESWLRTRCAPGREAMTAQSSCGRTRFVPSPLGLAGAEGQRKTPLDLYREEVVRW